MRFTDPETLFRYANPSETKVLVSVIIRAQLPHNVFEAGLKPGSMAGIKAAIIDLEGVLPRTEEMFSDWIDGDRTLKTIGALSIFQVAFREVLYENPGIMVAHDMVPFFAVKYGALPDEEVNVYPDYFRGYCCWDCDSTTTWTNKSSNRDRTWNIEQDTRDRLVAAIKQEQKVPLANMGPTQIDACFDCSMPA